MPHGVFALENHEPDGKRCGYAAADKETLPLFGTEKGVECAALSGSDMGERSSLATCGLQLEFAALERP
jgi:hypothetical protein